MRHPLADRVRDAPAVERGADLDRVAQRGFLQSAHEQNGGCRRTPEGAASTVPSSCPPPAGDPTLRFSRLLRAPAVLGACWALSSCTDRGSLLPDEEPAAGPEIVIERVAADHLACVDPCGMIYTYRTTRLDNGEPVATTLRLSANIGTYPRELEAVLPEGEAEFMWEFPRPRTRPVTHSLQLCPPAGKCVKTTVTLSPDPEASAR